MKNYEDLLINADCMDVMSMMKDDSVDLLLTDIPYDGVNLNESNGLRKFDKGGADVISFDLEKFLQECFRITRGTIIIFCGQIQISRIFDFFFKKNLEGKGSWRQLVWEKTNPSPMNGQYIYLSGIENAFWFKKKGGVFNAHCKNTVFRYPCGRSKLHPTEKNHALLKELILDNSNEGQVVFDPCAGSGSTLFVADSLDREIIGVELNEEYYHAALERLKSRVK